MKKDITDFSCFLHDYIYKKFGPLDGSVLKEDLGIDDDTYCIAIKGKKQLSKKTHKEVNRFISEIKKKVNNEVVLRQLIGRISFICTYGNVVIDNNHFIGQFVNGDNSYFSKIRILGNNVSSYVTNNSNFSNILCQIGTNDYNVIYDKKNVDTFKCNDSNKIYYDILSTTITKNYNRNDIETFRFKHETKNEFFMNEESGDIELIEPSYLDNYDSKECWWRVDGFSLSSSLCRHVGDEVEDTKYYIGIDRNPDSKDLVYPSESFGVSKENVELYTTGQISTKQLWEETRKNYPRVITYWL